MRSQPQYQSLSLFTETATTEIYTLSLHDALPISARRGRPSPASSARRRSGDRRAPRAASSLRGRDRKSTRLNSSHTVISYAVFCLKKKKKKQNHIQTYNKQKNNIHTSHSIHWPHQ